MRQRTTAILLAAIIIALALAYPVLRQRYDRSVAYTNQTTESAQISVAVPAVGIDHSQNSAPSHAISAEPKMSTAPMERQPRKQSSMADRILAGGFFNDKIASKMLSDKAFDALLIELSESKNSPTLTNQLENQIADVIEVRRSAVELRRLSCGESLCAVEFELPSQVDTADDMRAIWQSSYPTIGYATMRFHDAQNPIRARYVFQVGEAQ